MKKAGGNIFLKGSYFEETAKIISFRKNFSSPFQYSEKTINSIETNNTSTESTDTQLSGAGKSEGVALSIGLHLPRKDIEKKN